MAALLVLAWDLEEKKNHIAEAKMLHSPTAAPEGQKALLVLCKVTESERRGLQLHIGKNKCQVTAL